ncbi:MAG: methyltransferase domain-containing protein [Candidatus Falkowbacteria bacterium]
MSTIITDDISKYDKFWWEKFYTDFGHHNNAEELNTFAVAGEIVGDKSVIDVGCGEGEASLYFKNYKGIDWSQVAMKRANERFGNKFTCGDIKDIKDHFDYALFSQVFEHLENPKEYVEKIKKIADKVIVILPNGDIGKIIVDNDRNYLKPMEDVDYHYATYNEQDIRDMFGEVEFRNVGCNNLFFIV